jgi:predicted small lipoprotein YifL
MIQPGKYTAKVSDWGVKETKAGKPYVEVWFNIKGQGDIRWSGHLTEKTIERTLKSLAMCGLKGSLELVADGPVGKALDMNVEVEIETELKPDVKDPSKKWPNVKWINTTRTAKFDAAVSASAKTKLSQYAGNWAKIKGELKINKNKDIGF